MGVHAGWLCTASLLTCKCSLAQLLPLTGLSRCGPLPFHALLLVPLHPWYQLPSYELQAGTDNSVLEEAKKAHEAGKGPSVGTTLVQPNGAQLQEVRVPRRGRMRHVGADAPE